MANPPTPELKSADSAESEASPPSRTKLGWSLCLLAMLILTTGTTVLLKRVSPSDPLTPGAFSVVATGWVAVVLGIYYWRTRK